MAARTARKPGRRQDATEQAKGVLQRNIENLDAILRYIRTTDYRALAQSAVENTSEKGIPVAKSKHQVPQTRFSPTREPLASAANGINRPPRQVKKMSTTSNSSNDYHHILSPSAAA